MRGNRSTNGSIAQLLRLTAIAVVAILAASCASSNVDSNLQQAERWEPKPLSAQDSAWLDSVKVSLFYCSRQLESGGTYGFYLIGEMHLYDDPSSRFADTLFALARPSMFLSEGAKLSGEKKSEFWKQYEQMATIYSDAGYDKARPSALAKARNIPIVALEKVDSSTGVYEGISTSELSTMTGMLKKINDPKSKPAKMVRRFMKAVLEHPDVFEAAAEKISEAIGLDTSKIQMPSLFDEGVIGARNEIMAGRAVPYLDPDSGCIIIRFGEGHAEGMMQQLAGYDCDCEWVPLQEWFRDNR